MGREAAPSTRKGPLRAGPEYRAPPGSAEGKALSPTIQQSVRLAVDRAEAFLRSNLDQGGEAWVWEQPAPVFRRSATGQLLDVQWAIRLGLGMVGWNCGFVRRMNVLLPLYAPAEHARQTPALDEAQAAVESLRYRLKDVPIKVMDADVQLAARLVSRPRASSPSNARANTYNRSPSRAVRLRRAARTAMKSSYF